MNWTFDNCTSLLVAPEIPSSVTSIGGIFYGCTSLTTAPEIPSNVISIGNSFYGCTSLTTAPKIPSNVTSMNDTFKFCTNLITAPTIPSSVTEMYRIFLGCKKIQGTIEINAEPSKYGLTFGEDAASEGTGLVVTGTSSKLDEIIATGDSRYITKGE